MQGGDQSKMLDSMNLEVFSNLNDSVVPAQKMLNQTLLQNNQNSIVSLLLLQDFNTLGTLSFSTLSLTSWETIF